MPTFSININQDSRFVLILETVYEDSDNETLN